MTSTELFLDEYQFAAFKAIKSAVDQAIDQLPPTSLTRSLRGVLTDLAVDTATEIALELGMDQITAEVHLRGFLPAALKGEGDQ